jgi:hypothetical protein
VAAATNWERDDDFPNHKKKTRNEGRNPLLSRYKSASLWLLFSHCLIDPQSGVFLHLRKKRTSVIKSELGKV